MKKSDPEAQPTQELKTSVIEGKINKYGFLRLSKEVYQIMGLPKDEDIPVTITVNPDGSLIVQRAS